MLNSYEQLSREQLIVALNRAETLYVKATTSQFIARVDQLQQLHDRQKPSKTSVRQFGAAIDARDAAQDDARSIFFDVVTGLVDP